MLLPEIQVPEIHSALNGHSSRCVIQSHTSDALHLSPISLISCSSFSAGA